MACAGRIDHAWAADGSTPSDDVCKCAMGPQYSAGVHTDLTDMVNWRGSFGPPHWDFEVLASPARPAPRAHHAPPTPSTLVRQVTWQTPNWATTCPGTRQERGIQVKAHGDPCKKDAHGRPGGGMPSLQPKTDAGYTMLDHLQKRRYFNMWMPLENFDKYRLGVTHWEQTGEDSARVADTSEATPKITGERSTPLRVCAYSRETNRLDATQASSLRKTRTATSGTPPTR